MTDIDLLAGPSPNRHLVSAAALGAALRRRRTSILALAVIGALAGGFVSLALPAPVSAATLVYLRFPDGTDAGQAMPTELTILKTRAVALAALQELHSGADASVLLSKYRGTIASNGILRISATASDTLTAQRRANAVAHAYLASRAELGRQQLAATVSALQAQRALLERELQSDQAEINATTSNGSTRTTAYTDLLDDVQQRAAQIQEIDSTIEHEQVSAQSVAEGSYVIEAAFVTPASTKKAAAKNSLTGIIAALVLGIGGVLLSSVVTSRPWRRADIAAVLDAPVVLSLGPIVGRGWRRFIRTARSEDRSDADLERLVGTLERRLMLAPTWALVVVSIQSLDVSRLAVLTLIERLRSRGLAVSLVNESGRGLPDTDTEGADGGSDVIIVLATLDPATGAEHLREWGSDAVAIVTAGRSTETTLAANATMVRNASLDLVAVVLVGSDVADTTLGIVPRERSLSVPHADEERLRSTVESS